MPLVIVSAHSIIHHCQGGGALKNPSLARGGGELTRSILHAVSNCFCPFYHPSLSGGALKNPSLARGGGELTRGILDAITTCFCPFRRGRAVGNHSLEGEESSGRLTNFLLDAVSICFCPFHLQKKWRGRLGRTDNK